MVQPPVDRAVAGDSKLRIIVITMVSLAILACDGKDARQAADFSAPLPEPVDFAAHWLEPGSIHYLPHESAASVWIRASGAELGGDGVHYLEVAEVLDAGQPIPGLEGFAAGRPVDSPGPAQLKQWLKGRLLLVDDKMRASAEGVYAAGEIMDPVWRQVATSVGQGAAAGMALERYISSLED